MKQTVRIVVLGEEGVGKSSLISSFVAQCFPEKVRCQSQSHSDTDPSHEDVQARATIIPHGITKLRLNRFE